MLDYRRYHEGGQMADKSMKEQPDDKRQEALVVRLEEALPGPALGLLQSAEARYVAAVSATTAQTTITTTTTT
jgi:hypothetical protein